MPSFEVKTPQHNYSAVVERAILGRVADYLPAKAGKVFVVTTEDVWRHQGQALQIGRGHETLFLPGGESHKRLAHVEAAAEQMVARGADRSSLVIAFGGGIVNDMAGFPAAIFIRGLPAPPIPPPSPRPPHPPLPPNTPPTPLNP